MVGWWEVGTQVIATTRAKVPKKSKGILRIVRIKAGTVCQDWRVEGPECWCWRWL